MHYQLCKAKPVTSTRSIRSRSPATSLGTGGSCGAGDAGGLLALRVSAGALVACRENAGHAGARVILREDAGGLLALRDDAGTVPGARWTSCASVLTCAGLAGSRAGIALCVRAGKVSSTGTAGERAETKVAERPGRTRAPH